MGQVFGRGLCWELLNEHPLTLRKFPELKAVGSCGSVAEKISYICLAFPLPLTLACGLWWKQDVRLNGFFIRGSIPLPLYSWRITLKHVEPHNSNKPVQWGLSNQIHCSSRPRVTYGAAAGHIFLFCLVIHFFLCVLKILVAVCIQLHCSGIPTTKPSFCPSSVEHTCSMRNRLNSRTFSMSLCFEEAAVDKNLFTPPPTPPPIPLSLMVHVVASILATFEFSSQKLTGQYTQGVGLLPLSMTKALDFVQWFQMLFQWERTVQLHP